eukprot:16558_1
MHSTRYTEASTIISELSQHLSDLFEIEPAQRRNDIKLLNKICDNILSNPLEIKYHDLNFGKIRNKLCSHSIALLLDVGFKTAMNGSRLKWECNDVNYNSILSLKQKLQQPPDNRLSADTQHEFILDPAFDISKCIDKKHLYSSKIIVNNNCQCELSVCPCLKRIAKILKCYDLYTASKEQIQPTCDNDDNKESVTELLEFGFNIKQINAAIALSNNISISQQKQTQYSTDVNSIFSSDIYEEFKHNDSKVALLNDFNHLLFTHSNEGEEIYNSLKKKIYNDNTCNLSRCIMMKRNRRNRDRISNEYLLNELYFNTDTTIQQILDSIHCFYLHTFDIGFKLTKAERQSIMHTTEETKSSEECYCIRQIHDIVKSKQATRGKTSKFNSNVYTNQLTEYSYGFRFYYWSMANQIGHKEWNELMDMDRYEGINRSNHCLKGGEYTQKYPTFDIHHKYDNLKEEVTMNEICFISDTQWNNEYQLAHFHQQTDKVKSMLCFRKKTDHHYDMRYNDPMSLEHIIVLRLYSSYDSLQRKFTETFRKSHKTETIESLICRHKNYYWFARRLRENAECFGMKVDNKNKHIHVFTGLNQKVLFPAISAFINGPLSTSTEYSVAVNFCGTDGMILELDIDAIWWDMSRVGAEQFGTLSCIDMHWISDFKNEQEILFIGGYRAFQYRTIIDVSTCVNYGRYLKGLRVFLQWTSESEHVITNPTDKYIGSKSDKQIAFRLLSDEFYRHNLNHTDAHNFNGCPKYIRDVMHSHCQNVRYIELMYKTEVIMNYFFMDEKSKCINFNLLMTIFPRVKLVRLWATEQINSFLSYKEIIETILQFIVNNRHKNLSLLAIYVDCDVRYYAQLSKYVKMKKDAFESQSWDIVCKRRNNVHNETEWNNLNALKEKIVDVYGSVENALQSEIGKQMLEHSTCSEDEMRTFLSDASDIQEMCICIGKYK